VPEVHADGEIWAETLWDLRSRIGSFEAERVITQGMRLSPPGPSFLDARDAILAAAGSDAQRGQIWSVFAARGMGYYASTTGSDDVAPVEDFSPPPTGGAQGTISGRITSTAGAPLPGAKVALGSLVAVAGADGRYSLAPVPARGYANLIITAPGYDRVLTPVTVAAGQATSLDRALRRNWAAQSGGASATGSDELAAQGCGSLAVIDQHPGTAVSSPGPGPKTITIKLPATIDVDHFEVDPAEGCFDTSTSATRSMAIATSPDGSTWTDAATRSFSDEDRHRMNVVTPTAGRSGVLYVRVTFDAPGAGYVDLTELAVYTDPPSVPPEPTPTPTASPEPPVPTATATATPLPPAPVPTVTPAPTPPPLAKPSFKLAASGKRSVRVTARCAKACRVTAKLTVSAATARKLHSKRTLASVKRTLKAGSTRFTVKVTKKARFTRVRRVKATLTVRSGSVVTRRTVTIRR
jgi:hypothetical protein